MPSRANTSLAGEIAVHRVLFNVVAACARRVSLGLDAGVYRVPKMHETATLELRRDFADVMFEHLPEEFGAEFLERLEDAYGTALEVFEGADESDNGADDGVDDGADESDDEAAETRAALLMLARYDIILRLSRAMRSASGCCFIRPNTFWSTEVEALEYCIERDPILASMRVCKGVWRAQ
jgi:hypothetical protein